jgi:hypothetical protein
MIVYGVDMRTDRMLDKQLEYRFFAIYDSV